MAMTNQTVRVLELLKRFNNGQKVCIESLQNDPLWWSDKTQEPMSEKSIRRDLDVIKKMFPESFELIRGGKGEKGCYKAVTKQSFDNFMKPEVLSLMVQTFNMASRSDMFERFDLDDSDKKIISKKVKDLESIYDFKSKPFENTRSDNAIFKKLESSIRNQKYINIEYYEKDILKKYEVKPYKIVFINENFYLACEIDTEYLQFAMYRISKIKSIEDTKKTYQRNIDIENFIKDMQSPFSRYTPNYRENLIEVIVNVSSAKAFYFKSKKHLKSQEIVKTNNDGSLEVKFKVTQELELEELIKRWIPHVKVISPLSLKEKIENELREYLN